MHDHHRSQACLWTGRNSKVRPFVALRTSADIRSRVPNARSDPAYALPELNALLDAIKKTEQDEQKSMENVLSLDPDM